MSQDCKSQAGTGVWTPSGWPSLYKFAGAILATIGLHLANALSRETSSSLLLVLTVGAFVKTKSVIEERRFAHKVFDRGNVPSVGNKHVLSGNLFEVITPHRNVDVIHKYHLELGPTFGMFYGPDPWVFTVDVDLLQRLFVTEGHRHIDLTQFRLPFSTEYNLSLGQQMGEAWRRTRRTLNPSFTLKQMKSDNVYEDINRSCAKLLDCVRKHPVNEASKGSRTVDVLMGFKKFTVDVIFQVAFGHEHLANFDPDETDELIETVQEAAKLIRGWLVWIGIMFEQTQRLIGSLIFLTPLGKCKRIVHQALEASLAKRRDRRGPVAPGERKMIDTIMESVRDNQMTDAALRANLFFIFAAGFDTSSNTLTILFWLLARHQRAQDKLRAALLADAERAEYLDWCIQETLRLYPAVPVGTGRVLRETIEHKGQTFYAGTTILASIYSLHRWPELWGDSVLEFEPERHAERPPGAQALRYFAFAQGPRYCMGANLAMAEMRAIATQLLVRFRVEPSASTPEQLPLTTPNMIHMIIDGRVELNFVEISAL